MARLGIQKVHVGAKDTNCYLVTCTETRETVVIDPGDDPAKIQQQMGTLTVRWIVFTHAHPGHVGAKDALKAATGAPTAMHLADATANLKSADRYLVTGDSLPFGTFTLEVRCWPRPATRRVASASKSAITCSPATR